MRPKYQLNTGLLALILISLIIITSQCIEEYNPDVSSKNNLLVVNGSIVRGEEQQSIVISRSTSVNQLRLIPVKGCKVSVRDDKENVFHFKETEAGRYDATIDPVYLETGAKFKLSVETPDEQIYESAYEEIYDSPSIDSVYFVQERNSSDQQYMNEDGQRMNVDVYAKEGFMGYYRWKMYETFETRSSNIQIEKMLTGVKDTFITIYKWDTLNSEWLRDKAIPIPEFEYFNTPDTFHICYHDSEVEEVFYSNTSNILTNSRKRVPLQFIPNGPKLSFRYSCLLSRYTLSEEAYNYWLNKETELKESGGLFYTQPGQNLSNIKNINDEQEVVLGYFWVAEMKQKRVFFKGPYVGRTGFCNTNPFDIEDFYVPTGRFGQFIRNDSTYFPVYITNDRTSPPGCFDCRFSGGTLERPDFW
jgi:hypothetical protein